MTKKKKAREFNSDWLKETEWHLYNYKVHKNLSERYQERYKEISLKSSGLSLCPKRGGGKTDPTEAQALKFLELGEKIGEIGWYIKAIEDILPLLTEEEKYIIGKRYFSARPKAVWQIAGDIFISRSEYYRRRKALLKKFARGFGFIL